MRGSLSGRNARLITVLGYWLLAGSVTPVGYAGGLRDAAPALAFRVARVEQVAQLIGPTPSNQITDLMASDNSINDTIKWGICSGDLGSLMYLNGTAYIALGDNYTSCPPGTGGPGPNLAPPDWRSNALGIIPQPQDFRHGLHISRWYSLDHKHAAEVIPSRHNAGDCQGAPTPGCEVTTVPTYGFTSQGRLFLAYMSVHNWTAPAEWAVNFSSFAVSADAGHTWTVERNQVQWGPDSNFAQVAISPDPDRSHLLFFGIPGGRFGAVKLMRVRNRWSSVLSKASYDYFVGTDRHGRPAWSKDETRAVAVASAPVGELSVIYNPGLGQWLMTYLQGGNDQVMPASDNLVIRSAPHYWGPWSSPETLVSHEQFPQLYGAFMEPHFLDNGGRTVYFVMSLWQPYAVFWMRATLEPKYNSQ